MLLYVALVEGHIQGATMWTEIQDLAMRRAKWSGTLSVRKQRNQPARIPVRLVPWF
jgi:hypothetical protein